MLQEVKPRGRPPKAPGANFALPAQAAPSVHSNSGAAAPLARKPRAKKMGKAPKGSDDGAMVNSRLDPCGFPGDERDENSGPPTRNIGVPVNCGRCSTSCVPSGAVPLSINCCDFCFGPSEAFLAMGMNFAQVCGQCAADAEFDSEYTKACEVAAKSVLERRFPDERVYTERRLGYTVVANCAA